jgi:hypothetical protein
MNSAAPSYSCNHPQIILPRFGIRRGSKRKSLPLTQFSTIDFALSPAKVLEQLKEEEALKPLPREVEGLVDDPSVHNPLQRMERLGTGWFGVIMEHDGVLFQDTWDMHMQVRNYAPVRQNSTVLELTCGHHTDF